MGISATIKRLFGKAAPDAIDEASRPKTTPARYRVQRVVTPHEGEPTTLEAYAGDDGSAAVVAWERYVESDPADYPGELRFVDAAHGVRNRVTR